MEKKLELGEHATDRITGISGTVTGRVEYISGNTELQITSTGSHEGKPVENWFGESRLFKSDAPTTLAPMTH